MVLSFLVFLAFQVSLCEQLEIKPIILMAIKKKKFYLNEKKDQETQVGIMVMHAKNEID